MSGRLVVRSRQTVEVAQAPVEVLVTEAGARGGVAADVQIVVRGLVLGEAGPSTCLGPVIWNRFCDADTPGELRALADLVAAAVAGADRVPS
jgi:hypothetical protein